MTIAQQIDRIKTNVQNTFSALEEKGALLPQILNSDFLVDTVNSINTGGTNFKNRFFTMQSNAWVAPQIRCTFNTMKTEVTVG